MKLSKSKATLTALVGAAVVASGVPSMCASTWKAREPSR